MPARNSLTFAQAPPPISLATVRPQIAETEDAVPSPDSAREARESTRRRPSPTGVELWRA